MDTHGELLVLRLSDRRTERQQPAPAEHASAQAQWRHLIQAPEWSSGGTLCEVCPLVRLVGGDLSGENSIVHDRKSYGEVCGNAEHHSGARRVEPPRPRTL